jgi:TonB family protein
MHSASILIGSFFMNAVWQVTLIAAAGWLAARLLRRFGPQAEHVAWVFTLMAAIVIPFVSLLPWVFAALFSSAPTGLHGSIIISVAGDTPHSLRDPWVLARLAVQLCIALYFGSLFYFSVRFFRAWLSTARLLRAASPVSLTPEQREQWAHCQRRFLVKGARILNSAKIPGPVALGLRSPVLLLPAEFAAQCESQDFLAALAHECAHIQRRDFQKNLFYEIASLLVAFHPAVWFVKSQIAQTREMACDAMVTETLVESRSYAHSLLRLAAMVAAAPRISTSPAIGIFDANILEKRIMLMNTTKRRVGPWLKFTMLCLAVVLLFSAAVAGTSMSLDVEQPSSSIASGQPSPYGHVYRVGNGVTAPVPINTVDAEFPKSALQNKKIPVSGIVVVQVIVDALGMPRDPHVVRSYKPDFDAQAIKAAERYRFKPAEKAGKPVAVSISIEVNFKRY